MNRGKNLSFRLRILTFLLVMAVLPAGVRSVYAKTPTILLVSDCSAPGTYTGTHPDDVPERDNTLVSFLEGLGYTVDTSGMNKAYQKGQNPFNDPAKLAALDAADLVLVSRHSNSLYYDDDRQNWNEIEKPLLLMSGYFTRGGGDNRWGWTTGGSGNTSLTETDIVIEAGQMGHPFVAGFTTPIHAFDWSSAPTPGEAPKTVFLPNSAPVEGVTVIGTFDNIPILMDIPAGTDFDAGNTGGPYGIAGGRRAFLGTWGYDIDLVEPNRPATFTDFLTGYYLNLFAQTLRVMAPRELIIYVDDDAAGLNDGTSWENAYNYLQDALKIALWGDEIRVAQGIYKPDQGAGITPGSRSAAFRLITGVAIYGSYAGIGVQNPDERDPNMYETTLSGDIGVVDVNTDNSYRIVIGMRVDETSILDGFTITAACSTTYAGGGMLNYLSSSPTVNNCTFTDNVARYGGGMHNDDSSPTVTNCTFSENSAVYFGGGMANGYDSSPTVTNCTFSGNNSGIRGGGMYNFESSPTVTNCTFSGDSAADDGGGMCNIDSSPIVTNCTFSENMANVYGGGMFNTSLSSPTVTSCAFTANTAGTNGGGMYNGGCSPTVTNCTFSENFTNSYGGGMYNSGSSPTVTNCIFNHNIAEQASGGGIANYDSSHSTITNCTFSGNTTGGDGGGIRNWDSSPTVTNCILWGNEHDEISSAGSSEPVVNYSDIRGGHIGSGNIEIDPNFVDANNPDPNLVNLRLLPDSPCIDKGSNNAPNLPPTDLAGNRRIFDGDGNGSFIVDMGAYEFGSLNLLAHWKLDESFGSIAYDSSGDNHGTLQPPTPPLWRPAGGWFNGALQLDGADDYVDCGNDESLNITNEITLSVWVNTNDAGNGEHNPYVSKGDHSYGLKHQQDNNIEFVIYDDWWYYVWYPVDSSFNGAWHHLAGTYDGFELKLYVDGVLEANSPHEGLIAGSTFNVNIGRNSEETDRFYNGLIDDVVIFDRALTPAEIVNLKDTGGNSVPGAIALWELDESSGSTAYDSSGNGIHGTLEPPPPPLWQPAGGQVGGALLLDGVDDYVDCGNDERLNITDEITLSVWVKTNDAGNGEHNPYVTKGDHSYAIKHHGINSIEFFIYDSGWHGVFYSVDNSFNGAWHHLAGTYDGSQLELYVDGDLKDSPLYAGSIAGSTLNVNIGRNAEITDRFYDGLIDDVAIFSRALNETEINNLKNNGGASFIGDPNLEALWELDESSGTMAYDSSGNGIDGKLEPGPPPIWQPAGGQLDGALEFDGWNNCVYIPNESRFDITYQVTVSAWIKVEEFDKDWQAIVTKGDSAWRLHRLRDTNSIAFHCNLYPDEWGADGSVNVNNGQWHHVAGVYDGTRAYLYVDGALDSSEAAFGLIGTNNHPVMIGENAERPGRFWNGLIDDVRIYACALGPPEIYQLYSTICYVDADATGNNDGSSWNDAFNYLQDALVQAAVGWEIRVAEGTYKPDANSSNPSGTGDRFATFQLIDRVTLKGGYAGFGQPDPNARDVDTYHTVLSGDIGTIYNDTDNSYHVVTSSWNDATSILDGFTVTRGHADGSFPHDSGAGMFNSASSPTVTNCTFSRNTAYQRGGGMFNQENSNPTVTNCMFSNNSAAFGAGMRNNSSSPTVTNCTFSENTAGGDCGGMENRFNSYPTVTNCTFSYNSSSRYGGGITNQENSNPTVTNCTFADNTADVGGGMYNYNNSSPTLTNCTFRNNSARAAGGMNNHVGCSPILTNCIFTGNIANQDSGGMSNHSGSNAILTNCVFANNSAGNSIGGMQNAYSSPTLTNCTFANNNANNICGGMHSRGAAGNPSLPVVVNCIFWNDTPQEISNDAYSPVTVTYSNVEGGWGDPNDPNNTNISADPYFVDANNPDPNLVNLRLRPGSPCIDAGDNSEPNLPLTDLDDHPRIIDGDCDDIDVVDMGAYEFAFASVGDFDNNCRVDFFDISILGRAWETKAGDPGWDWACDISYPPDDYIDWRDAAVLCDNWLAMP